MLLLCLVKAIMPVFIWSVQGLSCGWIQNVLSPPVLFEVCKKQEYNGYYLAGVLFQCLHSPGCPRCPRCCNPLLPLYLGSGESSGRLQCPVLSLTLAKLRSTQHTLQVTGHIPYKYYWNIPHEYNAKTFHINITEIFLVVQLQPPTPGYWPWTQLGNWLLM